MVRGIRHHMIWDVNSFERCFHWRRLLVKTNSCYKTSTLLHQIVWWIICPMCHRSFFILSRWLDCSPFHPTDLQNRPMHWYISTNACLDIVQLFFTWCCAAWFFVVAAVLLLPDAKSNFFCMSGMFRRSRRRMSSKYTKKYWESTECWLANANPIRCLHI